LNVTELYDFADQNDIDVGFFLMRRAESFSAPLFDGSCCIAIDPTRLTGALDEKMKLGHELGHCATYAFYTKSASEHERIRQERRAERWQIEHFVPKQDFLRAIRSGVTEPGDLADLFDTTEPFMRRAMWYYRNGNLAVESPAP